MFSSLQSSVNSRMVRVARGGRDGIESEEEDDIVGLVFSNGS